MVVHSIEELAFELGTDVENLPEVIRSSTKNEAEIDWDSKGFDIGACENLSGEDICRRFEFPAYLTEVLSWIDGGFDRAFENVRSNVNDQIDLYLLRR